VFHYPLCLCLLAQVIDFAYLPTAQRVVVVELSPFLPCTGPSLFSWKQDHDVLHHGPLEFRLKEEPHPFLQELVETNWEDRWRGEADRYTTFLQTAGHVEEASLPKFLCKSGLRDDTRRVNLLFVYGTLKRGFHWHHKYMFDAEWVGEACTVASWRLVVGDCGVPYLVDSGDGAVIRGQLWLVTDARLQVRAGHVDPGPLTLRGHVTPRDTEGSPRDTEDAT